MINANIDEREKKSAIVDLLGAGIHTFKNTLLLLLYYVAINPEYQEKIIQDTTKAYLKVGVHLFCLIYFLLQNIATINFIVKFGRRKLGKKYRIKVLTTFIGSSLYYFFFISGIYNGNFPIVSHSHHTGTNNQLRHGPIRIPRKRWNCRNLSDFSGVSTREQL